MDLLPIGEYQSSDPCAVTAEPWLPVLKDGSLRERHLQAGAADYAPFESH